MEHTITIILTSDADKGWIIAAGDVEHTSALLPWNADVVGYSELREFVCRANSNDIGVELEFGN